MVATAQRSGRSEGGPPPDGPRFALRFDERGGALTLARPFGFSLGVVEELELGLGALRFPIDLSAGPSRFRTRRTLVRAASLRLELDALLEAALEPPFEVAPLRPTERGMGFAVRDAFGTVAFDAHARFEGSTLRVAVGEARAALEAPAAPLARLALAARALGLTLEPDRGAFTWARSLSALLVEALVPHGWRIPDDRGCRLTLEWLGPRRLRVRTLGVEEPEPPVDVDRWEAVHRLSPVVHAVASGDADHAVAAFEALRDRGLSVALQRRAATLGLGEWAGDDSALGASVAFRRAMRDGRPDRAAALAETVADREPCDALAVEALCAAADRLGAARGAAVARLLERAIARRPSDLRIALRLVEALARLGRQDELQRAVDQVLAMREPGPARGALARDAAAICELAGRRDTADHLFRVAAAHLPHDARALEGAAAADERAGRLDEALDGFDRAAARFAEEDRPDDEARALRRAATAAEHAGRLEGAETRWTRASRVRPTAEAFAEMARLREKLGRHEAAGRAEDRLLERVAELRAPTARVAAAVLAGARRAVVSERFARAREWVGALRRLGGPASGGLSPDVETELRSLEGALAAHERATLLSLPARLLDLPPERLVDVLAESDDPTRALREAAAAGDPASALTLFSAAATRATGRVAAALADAAAELAEHASEAESLLAVEPLVTTPDAKSALAEAAWERLRGEGRPVEAALALARAGAAKRDTAMLRAALSAAERAGDREAALSIAELALDVVGSGPARRSLEAVIARLREA